MRIEIITCWKRKHFSFRFNCFFSVEISFHFYPLQILGIRSAGDKLGVLNNGVGILASH